ncbi:MAG: citrate lyase subunit beta / citryl-CoA lyase [Methylobacteriaceae bacterium]|jgi:citrate lyase subunit beta/citryl-CoA lyase|nr:citrate lyase subunit beta / citryl-CoA lyase [Methylobacteriaceae bacterium]
MRSLLFVPADSDRKMEKSLSSVADCLFLDLEDSVAAGNKEKARQMARDFLRTTRDRTPRPRLYVRVNALDSGLTDADLDVVMQGAPEGIVQPKPSGGADLQHLSNKIAVREAENELADGATRVIVITTETAGALFHMGTYVGASRRLAGLTWGAEDLSADLGAETSRLPDGTYTPPYILARNLALFAAHAARVQAIDTVYPNFRDEAGFRRECEAARRDGFTGKMAIHPAQVPIINEVFTSPEAEVARARAVVEAFAREPDAGVIGIGGEMYDRPHLERAKRLLARLG